MSDSLQPLWTVAHQTPLSMGLTRQEYWSGLPLPSQGYLPNTGNEPRCSALQADSLPFEPLWQKLRVKLRTPHPQLRAYVTQTMRQSPIQERFLTKQKQKARF